MIKFIMFSLLALAQISCYAIQGAWRLTNVEEVELPAGYTTRIDIRDFIFRNTTLRYTISFSGCVNFKYMMDIDGNNLYIDSDTFYLESDNSQNCSSAQVDIERRVSANLKKIFTFQIISQYMIFSSPLGAVLLKFQRILDSKPVNITGAWMASNSNSNEISQMVQINAQNVVFCQRLAQLDYKILQKNKIQFSNLNNKGCQNQNFVNSLQSCQYFVQRKNSTIQLYNENDDLLYTLQLITNLQNANQLRSQQNIINPNPVFNVNSNANANIPIFANNFSDLLGKWSISQVFNFPSSVNSSQFVVSNNTIIISLDCTTFILTYTLLSSNPIKIRSENFREVAGTCQNKDDGMYKTALSKISVFNTKLEGNKIIATILDQFGQQVFKLERQVEYRAQPNQLTTSQYVPPQTSFYPSPSPPLVSQTQPTNYISQPSTKSNGLQSGRYTILLLQRRDLPRQLITLSNNSFVLNICNQLQFSYIISNSKEISFSFSQKTSNNCDTTQQKLYIDFLTKVKAYEIDGNDIFLKNDAGQDTIALNALV